jgi:hypothetical protein
MPGYEGERSLDFPLMFGSNSRSSILIIYKKMHLQNACLCKVMIKW